jgi:hypothetical protein
MPSTAGIRRRRRQLDSHELVVQLDSRISELIKQNRQLKRQLDKLAARGNAAASTNINRALRTLQSRVERAVVSTGGRRRRKLSTNGRRTANRRRTKAAA